MTKNVFLLFTMEASVQSQGERNYFHLDNLLAYSVRYYFASIRFQVPCHMYHVSGCKYSVARIRLQVKITTIWLQALGYKYQFEILGCKYLVQASIVLEPLWNITLEEITRHQLVSQKYCD